MSLYVLDVLLWIIGIRGHIPHYDEFRPGRSESSPAANSGSTDPDPGHRRGIGGISGGGFVGRVWLAIRLL